MKIKLYGLIGYPLEHSFSETYFKEKFLREGIVESRYENFEIPKLDSFISILKSNDFYLSDISNLQGFNVTMPYKEEIILHLDSLDETAKKVAAVNVVRLERKDNKIILKGYNSDVFGFETSLLENLENKNIRALILGSGGASKAVAFVLRKLGIEYQIVSRQRNDDDDLMPYSHLSEDIIKSHKLIINTTPLGMKSYLYQMPEIDINHISSEHVVFDLIYNPRKTLLLARAEMMGAKIVNGFDMLSYQAEEAWRIWNAN
ncbi:MAG TPA: shikimate dehydrogenase [Bacteroidales bacterium]|nr:shikimate dehydrogenase [Bacteroidales bacterium]